MPCSRMVPDRRRLFLIRTSVGIAVRHGAENGTATERRSAVRSGGFARGVETVVQWREPGAAL